jgi:uncharacterized RDD family membrane protein YckC
MSHDTPSAAYGASPYPAPPTGYVAWTPAPARPPLASWPSRVGASVVDSLLDNAASVVGFTLFVVTADAAVSASGAPITVPSAAGTVALLLGMLVSLGVTIWNRFLRQGRTGQSVGKSALGLRLVSAQTGRPVGAGLAFGRDIAHVLDGVLYLGYLWPLWDPMNQTFADKIVGSVVVRAH